jgi:hypothetical protein
MRGTLSPPPYHVHTLNTRPPRTPDMTRGRRCRSSSRTPSSLTPRAQRRPSAESPLSVFSARAYAHHTWDARHHPCVHSPSHTPLFSPPAAAPTTICTTTRARSARGRCSSSPAPRYDDCASPLHFPGLPSTQEHSHTSDALPAHWEPDAQRHRHAQCSTPSASEASRSYRRGCATSLCGAATRTSAVRHLPPPFFRLVSPRLAGVWCAPSAGTTSGTGCRRGPSTAPPHRTRYPTYESAARCA